MAESKRSRKVVSIREKESQPDMGQKDDKTHTN